MTKPEVKIYIAQLVAYYVNDGVVRKVDRLLTMTGETLIDFFDEPVNVRIGEGIVLTPLEYRCFIRRRDTRRNWCSTLDK